MTYSLIIAGSTAHTTLVATALADDHRFEIKAIVTPEPKPIGRQQTITQNPLHEFATAHKIPTVLVSHKLDAVCQTQLVELVGATPVDFLLVVDFGYYVPSWLLKLAKTQPLNIHPSLLPRWRGSSPGQFVILTGEEESAVSLITVAKAMDQGDIWYQRTFDVDPSWHTDEYYQYAFSLIAPLMPQILVDVATGNLTPIAQPTESPTVMAGRLTKAESFIPWSVLRAAHTQETAWIKKAKVDLAKTVVSEPSKDLTFLAELLKKAKPADWPAILNRASKAFSPWPKLWTLAPTVKGDQRLIILETDLVANKLELPQLQLEGKTPASWAQLKTAFVL